MMSRDLATPELETRVRLTAAERRFLAIIFPTGTIATGSDVGFRLYQRGFVTIAKYQRYGITPAGAEAIKQYPESGWKMPQVETREWRR
jgi:hypothetical protein